MCIFRRWAAKLSTKFDNVRDNIYPSADWFDASVC